MTTAAPKVSPLEGAAVVVYVEVDGGLVQAVYASVPAKVVVIDHDLERACDPANLDERDELDQRRGARAAFDAAKAAGEVTAAW